MLLSFWMFACWMSLARFSSPMPAGECDDAEALVVRWFQQKETNIEEEAQTGVNLFSCGRCTAV